MITRRDFLTLTATGLLTLTLPNFSYANLSVAEKRRGELLELYHTRKPKEIKNHRELVEDEKNSYEKVTFLSSINLPEIPPHPINLEIYGSNGPAIMIPPALGGISKIERTMGRYYAENNFRTILVGFPIGYAEMIGSGIAKVTSPEEIINFSNSFNKGYEQAVIDHLQVIDWIEQNLPGKKGALGLSLGGIITTSLMGLDNRLDSAVLMLAGGNLHQVIAYSNQSAIVDLRERVLERIGKDEEWLKEELRGKINLDPMNLTQYIDPNKILLITAGNDGVVPTSLELEARFPKSEKMHLNGLGHSSSAIAWPNAKHRIKDFFEEHLL